MNRKLHNTFLAFSVTGLLLVGGLIGADPVLQAPQDRPAFADAGFDPAQFDQARFEAQLELAHEQAAHARELAIEAKAAAFEAELERSASAGEMFSHTVDFTADMIAEAAVAGMFADAALTEARIESKPQPSRKARLHRRARESLALPYFSFAQGMRRGNRS